MGVNKYLFFILLFSTKIFFCQELRIGVGYSNLRAKQFDNLIQTYNFSRPFLIEKQPILSNGVYSHLSYIFKTDKNLKTGIYAGYSMFKSKAENPNLELKLLFNMLELGYVLSYQNKDKFRGAYGEFGVNAVLGMLNKKVNNEVYVIDNFKVRSIHAGASFLVNIGCRFNLSKNLDVMPITGMYYSPYFWNGQSEIVINQTSELINNQFTSFWKFHAGIRIIMH